MTSTSSTRDVAQSFFDNFASGDISAVTSLFAPQINFAVHGSPRTPWSGSRTQRTELDGFFTAFAALGPATDYTVEHLLVEGPHAVALGHNAFPVTSTGKTFTNHFALHLTITNGQITGYQMYEDSYAIDQAFTPDHL